MKTTWKRIYLAFALLLTLLCTCFFGGCSQDVGTYQSTFVDSQNDEQNISFTLVINNDKTFVLTRYRDDEEVWEYSGYYKSYTESGRKQLLFIVEEGFEWSSYYPNAWNPYFSICKLDDGTLMATAGTTSSSSSVRTAFGSGGYTSITLILFAKE